MTDRFYLVTQRMRKLAPDAFPGPVTEAQVQQAEEELGVPLPRSYRRFLREFGAADFPFQIFGLEPEEPANRACSYWDVVGMTESERTEVEPAMPQPLVPFTPNGMGDHWCLDTAQMQEGECPVVFWNHEAGPEPRPRRTHATFLDWLEAFVTGREQDAEE